MTWYSLEEGHVILVGVTCTEIVSPSGKVRVDLPVE